MIDQQSSTPKSPIDAIVNAFSGLQGKMKMPEAAREFVTRSTATAKERAAELHAGASSVTGAVEGAIVNAVSGVADVNRTLLEAAHQDAEAGLVAIEKLAGAASLAEAYQLHVDYLRERGEVGATRIQSLAELVSAKVSDGVKTVHDRFATVSPFASKAA